MDKMGEKVISMIFNGHFSFYDRADYGKLIDFINQTNKGKNKIETVVIEHIKRSIIIE